MSAAFAANPAPLNAQSDGVSNGRARATVIQPLRAVALSDLSFGAIVVGRNQSGAITVPADGRFPIYSDSAPANCAEQTSCAPHRARFAVTGQSDRTYSVELPGQITAKGGAGGAVLIVSDLTMRSSNQPNRASGGRLDQSGQDRLFIGGTLRVPAGTRSDVYRASLPVMVTYD